MFKTIFDYLDVPVFNSSVKYNNEDVVLRITVPGLDKSDITVEVDKTILKVYSNKNDEFKFEKSFSISNDVDVQNISAKCDKGLLEITLPKKKHEKTSRSISIK